MNEIKYQQSQWIKMLWVMLPVITVVMMLIETNGLDSTLRLHALLKIVAINLVLLGLLGRLTIKIEGNYLRWYFGIIGWPAWKLALTDIRQIEECESRWIEGWGIRFTKEGMLYNAAGKGAVRITKADGASFRLGSAEPTSLRAALANALANIAQQRNH